MLLFRRKAIGGNGDENKVVDAENDLEKQERNQADPSFWCCKDRKIHLSIALSAICLHKKTHSGKGSPPFLTVSLVDKDTPGFF